MGDGVALVTGLHRSGTTYVAELLRRTRPFFLLDEPLNVRRGVRDVPLAYPYVGEEGGEYASLLDGILEYSRPWRPALGLRSTPRLLRPLRGLAGRRRTIRWNAARLSRRLGFPPRHVLWKDPFATLSVPYLLARKPVRAVVLVRHPAAVHYSTLRQGWQFDVENLRRQPELMARYGYNVPPEYWEAGRKVPAAGIALLWKLMIRVVKDAERMQGGLLVVRHEDLCSEPVDVAARIAAHFGLQLSVSARRLIARGSRGSRVEGREGRAHDFQRDSRALIDVWRGRIPRTDEALMQDLIGEDLNGAYRGW